ncbi:MAG TPA: ABC transporter permease [Chthoniobacterales bacterium]|nr:ABC transporter permease [Chthoniobacterales bacterium]
MNDFRFAFRQLWKAPGFTIAAVAVLALGIGVNTAIFSLVNVMVFQPPAYARPAEILQLFSQDKKDPKNFRAFSYPTYCDVRDQNTVFSGLLAHDDSLVGLGEKGNFRRAVVDIVSSNYFSVLGVLPAYGRPFLPEEEKPGAGARVAVVSYSYWQRHSRDPSILGSSLLINGRVYTIVGIMPEGFTGTESVFSREAWLPLGVYHEIMSDQGAARNSSLTERGSDRLLLIGRLKPGVTAEAAQPALKGLAANLEAAFPVEQKDQTFMTAPLNRFGTSSAPSENDPVPAIGAVLTAMAAVVLLVACLNLANMLLARGTARRKEIAIRLALGGTRARIVRQLLIEGFVLALLGGVCGLLLGLWSSDLLVVSLSKILPMDVVWLSGPNPVMLGATLGFCVLGTICFALGPALKLSRAAVIEDLKQQAGEDAHRPRWRFLPRNPLVVVQIAFSLALVTGAALFLRGAANAASVETGFQARNVFLVEVDASLGGFEQKRTLDLYRMVGEKFSTLPGVEHAGISATVPFGINTVRRTVLRAGVPPAADEKPATAAEGRTFTPFWNSVGADYFAAVGLPLLRGRTFTAAEATQPGGPAVAVIDEVLAKKLWPDGDALGQQIQFPVRPGAAPEKADDDSGQIRRGEPIEIIGIVPAIRNRLFEKEPVGSLYLPFARGFQTDAFFFVKFASLSPGSESAAAELLRRTVRSVDPLLPILELRSFTKHMDGNPQLWIVRAGAALFSIFGGLALGLAAVGVYGVKAYSVARRTREIGIRMALGAQGKTVQWMILREGLAMVAAGLALGLLLALGTGKIVSSILFDVSSTDPLAFTLAPAVLAMAALLATWLPARRATKISPMAALRTE